MTGSTAIRVRRSLMPTPCNVEAKLGKARSLPLDVLMLDLEDGVPDEQSAKARARSLLAAAVGAGGFAAREVAVRINGPRSAHFLEDATLLARLALPDGTRPTVVLPMVEDAADIIYAERTFTALGAPDDLGFILLIETPAAVLNLPEMATASRRTNGLIAGGLDYAMCLHSLSILPVGGPPPGAGDSMGHDEDLAYLRHRVLAVARANGLDALDAMRPGLLSDMDAFRVDAMRARWLGFDGVDFYHPAFVDLANAVFTPSAEELAWADRVLGANEPAGADAPASRKVDGRVILPQHKEIARRLRRLSDAIAGA